MKKQKIVWTALPNGIGISEDQQKQLRLSVFVSPRLEITDGPPEPNLSQFIDFSKNWVRKVAGMSFEVEFQNGAAAPATLERSKLDEKLWDQLFHENTYVRPFEYRDLSNRAIRTYPIKGVMSYLKNKYVKIGEKSPGRLPSLEPERDDEGYPFGDADATLEGFIDDIGELLTPEKEVLCEITGKEYYAFRNAMDEEQKATTGVQEGKYYVLAYITACLKQHKIKLSENAKIEFVNDVTWKIIDGENEYSVEDTSFSVIVYQYSDIYKGIDQVLKINKVLDPTKLYGYPKEQLDFIQANRFYDRREDKREFHLKPNVKHVPPPPKVEKIDFHQMLAMLGDHPILMRKLGIVLDLTISPIPNQSITSVKVIPKWNNDNPPSSFNEDISPITFCILKNNQFIAKPKPSSKIVNGMLNLKGVDDELSGSPSEYSLLQVDPEGSALKVLRAGSSMARQFKRKYKTTFSSDLAKKAFKGACDLHLEVLESLFAVSKDIGDQLTGNAKITAISGNQWIVSDKGKQFEIVKTPKNTLHVYEKKAASFDTAEDSGLASLRTAGISLFKSGRAYELFSRLKKNLAMDGLLNSSSDIKLYADDLIRGYRVDVLDESIEGAPIWRSLCRRIGKYFIGEDALNPSTAANPIHVNKEDEDEGYVKAASTSSNDALDSDLYLNETIFRWDGWSLVAQRPGKTIVPVSSEEKIYLFNWNDVTVDNTEFIAFLIDVLHARWTKKATIQKIGSDKIEVADGMHRIELLINNEEVTLITDTGREYFYTIKDESGDRNVYNIIPRQSETPEATVNKAETEFELSTVFSARPGSLPRLRFGHRYKLRARTVDIAGNSLSYELDDDSAASESICFTRFEPLLPPTLVPRAIFTEGEAVEHMVIRSNFDQTTQEYIATQDVVSALEEEDYTYEEGNERHIIPPKTSQLIAETHGEFDEYFGSGKDYEEGYRIALKEEGTIADKKIVNINTGQKEPIPNPDDIQIIIPEHDPGIPDEDVPGQYIIHKETEFLLPYLPDPIGRGVVLQNLPGVTGSGITLETIIDSTLELNLLKIPFEMDWPDSRPFRIRIEERPGNMNDYNCDQSFDNINDPPKWDAENRILTVFLGKAEVKKIKYSCYLNEDDLEKMGIWKWLRNSSDLNTLRKYALSGTHWMISPYRELTLIHAVQQPLCEPTIKYLNGIKHKIGDTMAEIRGELYLCSKSTGKVNLLAHWIEPVDDILQPAPSTKNVHANAFEVKIKTSFDNEVQLPLVPCFPHNHEFGDTKYRHVQYYLTGATRFREYFHRSISGTGEDSPEAVLKYCFKWDNIPGTDEHVLKKFLQHIRKIKEPINTILSKSPDGSTITVKEGVNSLDLKLNKDQNGLIMTKAGGETYSFVLTLNEDNKLCLSTDKISRQGQIVEVDILNSARPLAPKVQYILPTFGWEQQTDNNRDKGWKSFQRIRKGGGLRVYLDRPWYSSGDGELLGVTLYPHLVPDKLKSYVTQWGMDPIRKSKIPKGGLDIPDFENVEQGQTGLSLAELSDPKVNVAGFKVEYNPERQLWYSDIQINSDVMISYFPFIRLALARYQPNSIINAHLSRVVLTDFVQVANDRTLKLELKANKKELYISVVGRATGDRSSNRMEVTIESLAPGAHPEFGWVPIKSTKYQPNPYTLKLSPVDLSTYLWKWDAILKLPKGRSTFKYRLVVREYERFKADVNLDNVYLLSVALGTQHFVKDVDRMVYIDIVEL